MIAKPQGLCRVRFPHESSEGGNAGTKEGQDVHDPREKYHRQLQPLPPLHPHQVPDDLLRQEQYRQIADQIHNRGAHGDDADLHALPRDPGVPPFVDWAAVEDHEEHDDDVVHRVHPDEAVDDVVGFGLGAARDEDAEDLDEHGDFYEDDGDVVEYGLWGGKSARCLGCTLRRTWMTILQERDSSWREKTYRNSIPQEIPPEHEPCNIPAMDDGRKLRDHKPTCNMYDRSDLYMH